MSSKISARKRYDPLTGNDEYAVVRLRPSWGLLSIVIFVYSLPIRYWVRLLPWHPYQYWYRPGTLVLYTLGLSVLGMGIAWIGLRAERRAGGLGSGRKGSGKKEKGLSSSKVGLFLNGTVFGILVLAVIGLVVYWNLFR